MKYNMQPRQFMTGFVRYSRYSHGGLNCGLWLRWLMCCIYQSAPHRAPVAFSLSSQGPGCCWPAFSRSETFPRAGWMSAVGAASSPAPLCLKVLYGWGMRSWACCFRGLKKGKGGKGSQIESAGLTFGQSSKEVVTQFHKATVMEGSKKLYNKKYIHYKIRR